MADPESKVDIDAGTDAEAGGDTEAEAEALAEADRKADAARVERQVYHVASLRRKKAAALRARDFDTLPQLGPQLKQAEAYLERLKVLPGCRAELQALMREENWKQCKRIQREILAIENGHWDMFTARDHHLRCCGHTDPKQPCTELRLWDTMMRQDGATAACLVSVRFAPTSASTTVGLLEACRTVTGAAAAKAASSPSAHAPKRKIIDCRVCQHKY